MATSSHLWLPVYSFIVNVGEEDHTVQVLVESRICFYFANSFAILK